MSRIRVLTSGEFVGGFSPPDYSLDGVFRRGNIYSFCGKTGSGKTAIALRLLACTAIGRPFAGCDVKPGRCVMLVGENPDDVRARWIALGEQMGFDDETIDVHFIPGIFAIPDLVETVRDYAREVGDLGLAVVDTSAAYFGGDQENDNTQLGDHARQLRTLTDVPGRPCVIVNCHPVKGAAPDNLLPRGGGAFLNEMDGNATCKAADKIAEMHWQGKFRGPDFNPMSFEMVTVTSPRLVDSRGRPMPTVVARSITEYEKATMENAAEKELKQLLAAMRDKPSASIAELAVKLCWVSKDGQAAKSKVHRHLKTLNSQKLVEKQLDTWKLTTAGDKAAKQFTE